MAAVPRAVLVGVNPVRRLAVLLLRRRWWWWVGCAVAGTCAALGWSQRLDGPLYDLMAPSVVGESDSLVVAIDDASIARLGRWPWSREVHARLLRQLRAVGVEAVGYDVIFSEPAEPAGDAALVQALQGLAPARAVLPVAPAVAGDSLVELRPLPALAAVARLGHVDIEVDADGVARRLFLRGGVGAAHHLALGAVLLEGALPPGLRADPARTAGAGQWWRDDQVMLPRLRRALPLWSFADALESPAFAAAARGRVVWVGATAAGLGPSLMSPMFAAGTRASAVQWHAQAFEALKAGAMVRPWAAVPASALTLLMLAAPLAWRRQGRMALSLALATLLLPWAISAGLLSAGQQWWGPSSATIGLLVMLLLWSTSEGLAAAWRLGRVERQAKLTLEAIGEGVLEVDADGRVHYANPAARRLLGAVPGTHLPWEQVLPLQNDGAERLARALQQAAQLRRPVHLGGYLTLPAPADGGDETALRITVSPRAERDASAGGWVIALGDISEAVLAYRRLDHAATHDNLTGLPNRRLLQDRLEHALQRQARQTGTLLAVLFVDLDRFKRINDSLGHDVGDEVLRRCVARLRQTLREQDTVARWGGDEFVVLLEDLASRDAVVALARKVVRCCAEPIQVGDLTVTCGASVGIALAPGDGHTAAALLARADTAMYHAKRQGRGGYQFASTEMEQWTRDRLAAEAALRESIESAELVLHYQPLVIPSSGQVVALEALVRWRHPEGRLALPAEFLPLAEESGLMGELGRQVMDLAAGQQAAWRAAGRALVPVSINLSARQFFGWQLVDDVRAALVRHGIEGRLLKLELTEQAAMSDVRHAASVLVELRSLGVRLSVDDFGTGYSSLSHLQRFPLDELKIDRSFVQGMLERPDDAAIVRATIALGHELGLTVVAEGVETAEQEDFLRRQGCDLVQGFLVGEPMTADRVAVLLG